jgi:hypothetical protein
MKSNMHGSPKETGMIHGGKVAVPRELSVTSMPGKAAMGIKPEMAKSQTEGGGSSFKPKKMSVYREE